MTRNFVEGLENRIFMHTGPLQITSVVADNRGEVIITLNQPIRPSNVNTGAVQMRGAGPDGILGNGDDARFDTQLNYQASSNRIIIRADLPAGTGYRVKLVSTRIETADGDVNLDGEFNGAFPSGNGLSGGQGMSGGNFEFQVKNDKSTTPLVRMSTSEGVITLRMRRDLAPKTVNNFFSYSDARNYDNIFFTRNVTGFVIQGGSLQIDSENEIVEGPVRAAVVNEFNLSNTRGTVAMAKQGNNPNSATNQFFFNLNNNGGTSPNGLDFQNGGFTAFAQVTNSSGLAVMDAIAGRPRANLASVVGPFAATGIGDAPVKSTAPLSGTLNQSTGVFEVTGGLDPTRDLIVVRRTATLMRVLRL